MKLLHRILGIKLPNPADIKEQSEGKDSIIASVTFLVHEDGNVSTHTEWSDMSPTIATIMAKLLYEINTGNLEEGIMQVLIKYGADNIQAQEFIENIIVKYKEQLAKLKNLPIIPPSQVLKVK